MLQNEKVFKNKECSRDTLPKGTYENCTFESCTFSGMDLSHYVFEECVFKDCDLSNSPIGYTSLKDVFFENCKIMGLRFEHANPFLMELRFKECNLSFSSFYGLTLKNTKWENCILKEVDFATGNFTSSSFLYCNMEKVLMDNTNLSGCVFTGSYHLQINPISNNLKKATFSLEQLPGLLVHTGVVVN